MIVVYIQAQFESDLNDARRNSASLRDPAGYVFELDGRILRRLNEGASKNWLKFTELPIAEQLMAAGDLVPTWLASDIAVAQCRTMDGICSDETGIILEHERIPFLSYACEWSQTMLRDAALLHLYFMERLMPLGWTLKDANPANVQWRLDKPCLIDVASIEPYAGGPWRAYGQFCKTMLFPLFISAYGGGQSLQSVLKGYGLKGVDAVSASRYLRGMAVFKPGVFVHLKLQALLQRLADRGQANRAGAAKLGNLESKVSVTSVLTLIRGLRHALMSLPLPEKTSWVGYTQTSIYTDEQLKLKQSLVASWFRQFGSAGDVVLDVGANTGTYSKLLAQQGAKVIAVDADMACVDSLYRQAHEGVLPLVLNLVEPTGPTGWDLGEQKAFADRINPDWSIWLAVIHHLSVHEGVRMDEVVRRIIKTSRYSIVEFVGREDPMVQALLQARSEERSDYSINNFHYLISELGVEILAKSVITDNRTLYLLRCVR